MDTCPERHVLIMMMKVKDVLKLVMKVMKVMMLMTVKVVVKVFEEVLLFSLSSTPTQTTNPRTRPAARVWASGAKGLDFQFVAPAPGRRCSGPFS